jgi:hypothetical protein
MMKQRLLLFLSVLMLNLVHGQTNVYHPFPDSNAVWNEVFRIWGCGSWPYYHEERFSIVIHGDTTIGGSVYHQLRKPFVQLTDTCFGNFPMNAPGYAGCFSQDTAAKKVYYIIPNDTVIRLLYDFSLQLGDTASAVFINNCSQPTIVTNIDSVLIGSSYRKRWEWTEDWTNYKAYIVEGIGSMLGLLEPTCAMIDGPETAISCYRENNVVLYSNPAYPDSACEVIDATKNIAEEKFTVAIIPNPFHNSAELIFDHTRFAGYKMQLKIFNIMGEVVREEHILPSSSCRIQCNGLSNGLYFYELRGNNYEPVGNGKFVID